MNLKQAFPIPAAERFFESTRIFTFAVSDDERKLAFATNINGKYDLWGMDLPNTYPYRLSFRGQSIQQAAFTADNSLIAFGSDTDGNENYQIYLVQSNGSELIRVTEGDHTRNEISYVTKTGKVYFTSDRANPTYMNIFTYDLASGKTEQVFALDVNCDCFYVAETEGYLNYMRVYNNTFTQSYLYNLTTGEHILLCPDEKAVHRSGEAFFLNSEEVVFVTNYQAQYSYLMKYNLKTKEFTPFLKADGGIGALRMTPDKKWFTYIVEKGVQDYLYVMNIATGEKKQVGTKMSVIHQISIGASSENLYFLGSSATSTYNIERYNLLTGELAMLTNNRIPCIAPETLVEPETVYYKSFDGLEIEALLFKAKVNNNGHWLIWPHGGPQAAERKIYRSLFQYCLANGYSIFAPNFRGSSHYTADFVKMVEREWGEGPRMDMVKGVEWLIDQGYADRDKLFVMGGSYGGYMSLLLHGRHPELWKGVVDIFGPSNLFSFLNSVPEHWKPIMKSWLGDVEEDKERLTKDSPITYLNNMTKPMIVIQGANDPRVVKAESDQIVEKLRQNGSSVDYLVLADEGHGFAKRENEILVAQKIINFLNSLL